MRVCNKISWVADTYRGKELVLHLIIIKLRLEMLNKKKMDHSGTDVLCEKHSLDFALKHNEQIGKFWFQGLARGGE